VLNVEGPSAAGKDPWGNIRIGASASTKIKRSDFGVTTYLPAVGDEVQRGEFLEDAHGIGGAQNGDGAGEADFFGARSGGG